MKTQRHSYFAAIKKAGLASAVAAGLTVSGTALAETPNPYAMYDGSWITIDGTVESVTRDSFMLDYGEGSVMVEMDDGDRDADAYALLEGDEVRVSGRIDDDFFERTTIEARTVYVESIGTTFWASALDDETDRFYEFATVTLSDEPRTTIQGRVSETNDDEFVIDTGLRAVRVEVDDLGYNPLDDEGYLKIAKGDYVRVFGQMDDDLFEGREFEADSVIKLYDSQ